MEKLERYKGTLTLEQLITARKKTLENAKALYEEAALLYNNSKFARSYYLLCITNEELGKNIIVTSTIAELILEQVDWKNFWYLLRNHKEKTKMIEHTENIFVSSNQTFTSPENIQKMIPMFEEMKMASLYSDMFQNDFFAPNEIIPDFMVKSYYELTGKRLNFIQSLFVSDEQIRQVNKLDILNFRKELQQKIAEYITNYQ